MVSASMPKRERLLIIQEMSSEKGDGNGRLGGSKSDDVIVTETSPKKRSEIPPQTATPAKVRMGGGS